MAGVPATFSTIIGGRSDLSLIEKLDYLRGALTGPAKKIAHSFDYHPDSYKQTLAAIERRMKQLRTSSNTWFKAIKDLPSPRSHHAEDFYSLCDGIRKNIMRLKKETTFTLEEEYNVNLIMEMLEKKLHPSTNQTWQLHLQNNWTHKDPTTRTNKVEEFINFFEGFADIQAKISEGRYSPEPSRRRKTKSSGTRRREDVFTAKTVVKTLNKDMKKHPYIALDPFPCTFCRGRHATRKCQEKLTERVWKQLYDDKVCICCLKVGHIRRFCREREKCPMDKFCKHYHHSILHGVPGRPYYPFHDSQSKPEQKFVDKKRADNHCTVTSVECYSIDSTAKHVDVTNNALNDNTKPSTFIPTVVVPKGRGNRREIVTMLDTGSTHNFVSENVLPFLQSVTTISHNVHLTITKLNQSVEQVPTRLVKFSLYNNNGEETVLTAYVVKCISQHNSRKIPEWINRDLKELNINMNHKGGFCKPVELLIGISDLFKIFTGEIKQISPKFTLMGTIWGFIPTGNADYVKKQRDSECYAMVSTDMLSRQVEMTWQMENLDLLLNKSDKPMTIDEQFAVDMLKSSIQYDSDSKRYTVGLIFKTW